MAVRLVRNPEFGVKELRLWRAPSWPVGGAPVGSRAAEWIGRPGHPTSYALLGVHNGPDTATYAHAGQVFADALAGRADTVRFGLPEQYRGAVDGVLTADDGLFPCLAAHGLVGSSIVAFRAVALFLRDFDDELWSATDDEIWQAWRLALDAAE